MNSGEDCPFYTSSAISDPRYFVGREESLHILYSRMKTVQTGSVNVIGDHLSGKSSLLLYFVNTYQQVIPNADRFVVVYLSLQNVACHTQEGLFQRLVQLLETKLSEINYPIKRELKKLLKNKQWKAEKFNQLLEELKNQEMMPVLCLDNFEELLERNQEFPNGFYDNFRYLIGEGYLMMVMASCEDLKIYSQRQQITSDFFNVFQTIDLDGQYRFTKDEAEQLVALRNSSGNSLNTEFQKQALNWGARNPCLLQLAGQILWDAQIRRKPIKSVKKRFKEQAKRLYVAPKSPLLSSLYKMIDKLGFSVTWLIDNGDKHRKFFIGLLFLAILVAVLILFSYNSITFSQLKTLLLKLIGK